MESKQALSSDELRARHIQEEEYHDKKYSEEDSSPKHYKLNPTFRIFKRMIDIIGDIKGKRLLEYGCGSGWMTAELAGLGATIDSFDISTQAVQSTQELLKKHGLDKNTQVTKMGAEKLEFEDDSFDIVFGFAILHHLELEKALPELHRVLKPGGYAIFSEPLEGNPALKLYRNLTPQYRTVDEQPIVIKDFSADVANFSSFKHEEFYFISLIAFVLIYIPGMSRFFEGALKPLMVLDRFLLKAFPFFGRWAWYSIFTIKK